jgi:hypothetical protein
MRGVRSGTNGQDLLIRTDKNSIKSGTQASGDPHLTALSSWVYSFVGLLRSQLVIGWEECQVSAYWSVHNAHVAHGSMGQEGKNRDWLKYSTAKCFYRNAISHQPSTRARGGHQQPPMQSG